MNEPNTYTLEELAEAFDLTPRTARHYIENVLPPHHKTGRGKLARYGQDTWNCFSFIQTVRRESGFTAAQISDVLSTLDQAQIDRVAEGREEMRIVTSPSLSASRRQRLQRDHYHVAEQPMADLPDKQSRAHSGKNSRQSFLQKLMQEPELSERSMLMEASAPPMWKKLYADDELRISFKGEVNREKREQVDLAAKLIKKILAGSE